METLVNKRTLLVTLGFVLAVVIVGLIAGLARPSCHDPPSGGTAASRVDGQPWLDHRLPPYLIPVHYDLRLFPDFYDNQTRFYGNVTIRINVTATAQHLLVHCKAMNITRTELKVDGRPTQIDAVFQHEPNQYWVIQTAADIPADSVAEVSMSFDGSLTNGLVGLYRSTYLNSKTGQRRYGHA